MKDVKHIQRWAALADEAFEQSKGLCQLSRFNEAARKIQIANYCHERFLQSYNHMLTKRKERIVNIAGSFVFWGLIGGLVYLIITKK